MNPRIQPAPTHRAQAGPQHRGEPDFAATKRFGLKSLVALTASAGLVLFGVTSATAAGNTWYVSPTGSDTASGSLSSPLATVNAAVAKATAGDKIYVRGGTYHQQVTVSKDGLEIRSYPGETVAFDGTSSVTGWTKSGTTWVRDGWTVEFDHSPTYTWGAADSTEAGWGFVNPSYPMAAWPDQVFIDGQTLKQVSNASQVVAGTFAVDYAADKLIIGSDPTGRSVRASTLDKAMSIRGANTTLGGFSVSGYAPSVPHMGTITLERAGIKVENVDVSDNATTGISAIADNISLTNVTADRNGMLGIHTSGSYGLTLDHVKVDNNNTERFNQAPVSGGIKVHRSRNVTIKNSSFNGNLGTGVWFDVSNYNMNLLNNEVRNNTGHGIFLEISDTSVVAGNVITGNGQHGLQIDNTGHVKVWNNTFSGNARPLNIVQDDRLASELTFPGYDSRQPKPDPTVPWITQDVTVGNNLVSKPTTAGNCMLCVEDYTKQRSAEQMGVKSNGNVYRRSSTTAPNWVVVWSSGLANPYVYTDLNTFTASKGQESSGQLVTSDIVDSDARATSYAAGLTDAVAQPLPSDVAGLAGQTAGTKVLGAWSAGTGTPTPPTPTPPANQAPTASFTATAAKLSVALDASGSTDPDGSVASYGWDFGDGSTGTGKTAAHAYAAPGTYSVKLTVTDTGGATGTVTKAVTVSANAAPSAAFATTTQSSTATFDASGSTDTDGTVTGYVWDFGDGTTGAGKTATHAYAASGTYSVRLTVTDDSGASASTTKPVSIGVATSWVRQAYDTFGRSVSKGWGTADQGGAWTTSGSPSNVSVSNGVGVLTMNKGSGPSAYLNSTVFTDVDLLVSTTLDKLPAGGTNGADQGIVVRRVAGTGDYRARVRILPSGSVRLGLVRTNASGQQTTIAGETTIPGITFVAGTVLDVRVQATTVNGATTLSARVWRNGTAEPATWQLTKTDATAGLQGPGVIGFHSFLSGATTNSPVRAIFDNVIVSKRV